MRKIFFILIVSEKKPWENIFNRGQAVTWLKNLNDSEQYLASYSDKSLGFSNQNNQDHRRIEFAEESNREWNPSLPKFLTSNRATFVSYEGFGGLIPTTVSAIKYALEEYDPDLIIRTNVSSYWNLNCLRNIASQLPKSGFYGGVPGPIPRSVTKTVTTKSYASGAGIFMSSDIAEMLVSKHKELDLSLIDDLSIGHFMHSKKISLTPMERRDLNYPSDALSLSEDELNSTYHFRCKSGTILRRDVKIMNALHSKMTS